MTYRNIRLSELIAPHFHEVHRAIKSKQYTEYVLKGGRGSTKSSFIAEEIILLIKRNPNLHGLVCRQVANTLKDSVYAQLQWAISQLGLDNEFVCKKSPMEIIYKPTKQTIYFRGADDPFKIKSIKAPFGYIGIVWFEELDTFDSPEQIRSIEQSAVRGGNEAYIFKSFNPSKTQNNWANKYIEIPKENQYINHSTYLDVPKDWLGGVFLDEAEHLKLVNPRAYEHEYLGVPNATGGNVFDNVVIRKITNEELSAFDRIYMGVDWGWYPDPFVYVKCHYDANRRKLYILDEYRCNKTSNEDVAKILLNDKKVGKERITCDSAENKSVNDFRNAGINARGAIKGPGSVDYSMKWLQSLTEIIIDNERTPETATEFLNYEYEKNKNGDVISGYPDKDNHSIDAIRYALEQVWKRSPRGSLI